MSSRQKHRIELYRQRDASESVNAAIDFIRQNWRILLRTAVYCLLPLSIIQAIGLSSLFENMATTRLHVSYSGLWVSLVFGFFAVVIINALVWTVISYYNERDGEISDMTMADLRARLWRYFLKTLAATTVMAVISVPLVALTLAVMLIMPFLALGLSAVAFPSLLVTPVYLLEDKPLTTSVSRAFSLTFSNIGTVIIMGIVITVLYFVLNLLVSLPLLLMLFVGDTFFLSTASLSPLLTLLEHLFMVVICLLQYALVFLFVLIAGMLYGSLVQETDGISIANDINHFENL